jgi:hypothetical protein
VNEKAIEAANIASAPVKRRAALALLTGAPKLNYQSK